MPLTLLTDAQVSEYVAGLDLAQGSTAYTTMNAMLLLPPASFAQAVSAIAQGLITMADMRNLPAMNARLVEALISSTMSVTDESVLAWRYRSEWLPASIDVARLRADSIGDAAASIAARYTDKWGGIIRPAYDYTKTDETKYHSYGEAYAAYLVIANDPLCLAEADAFRAAHAAFRAAHPDLLQATDSLCPVLGLVNAAVSTSLFMERVNGGRGANVLLDYVTSASWRRCLPGDYARFMDEVAYPAMAASVDPARTGLPGAQAAFDAATWLPIALPAPGWDMDRARMARINLPSAYGASLVGFDRPAEVAQEAALLGYLEAARTALLNIHELISRKVAGDASLYRAGPGQSVGILLAITNP
jgi:hypothetical protein